MEMRITRPDTGEERWLHAQGDATFKDGMPIRLVGAVRDITETKRALEREKLLAREMNHRVQNIFAVVIGMVRMSARLSKSIDGLKDSLTGRLRAMASAHALIQPTIEGEAIEDIDVSLQALASTVLAPYMQGADRVVLDGPPVMLALTEASGLALILHEWGTNAAKHGCLSCPDGQLSLTWRRLTKDVTQPVAHRSSLELSWVERGGPAISGTPEDDGFGSRLILLTAQPPGFSPVETDWHPDGVRHRLTIHAPVI